MNITSIYQQQDFLLHRISYLFLETSQTMQSTPEFTLTQNISPVLQSGNSQLNKEILNLSTQKKES